MRKVYEPPAVTTSWVEPMAHVRNSIWFGEETAQLIAMAFSKTNISLAAYRDNPLYSMGEE